MERVGDFRFVVRAVWLEPFWSDSHIEYRLFKEVKRCGGQREDWIDATLIFKTKLYEQAIGLRDKLIEGGVE